MTTDDETQQRVEEEREALMELESLCMACQKNGTTKLYPTNVFGFDNVLVSSFECEHCGYSNSEVQSLGEIQRRGKRITIECKTEEDVNRQLVKSPHASITIPEVQFEMPPEAQKGTINTIEGFLTNAANGLNVGQAERAAIDLETTAKIQKVIDKLFAFARGEEPFTFILDDPSGQSGVEIKDESHIGKDKGMKVETYERTQAQTAALGYAAEDDEDEEKAAAKKGTMTTAPEVADRLSSFLDLTERSTTIEGVCHACLGQNETRMCITPIPNFREIIMMVTDCESCGYKDVEVKPSGAIPDKGTKLTLHVTSEDDLKRDVLKSDSAGVKIPEIHFEMAHGTLGGKYTTVEGIMMDMFNQLKSAHQFQAGDSADSDDKGRLAKFLDTFEELMKCKEPFTFILDDPLSNVFIGHSDPAKGGPDPEVEKEEYERTYEQNEEFGLNDMNTDHYLEEQTEPSNSDDDKPNSSSSTSPAEQEPVDNNTSNGNAKNDASVDNVATDLNDVSINGKTEDS